LPAKKRKKEKYHPESSAAIHQFHDYVLFFGVVDSYTLHPSGFKGQWLATPERHQKKWVQDPLIS
jgi:hypothetical protein